MVGYGNKIKQAELARRFQEKFTYLQPISQATISKIKKRKWTCTADRKRSFQSTSNGAKLDVLLEFAENPHSSSQQAASVLNVSLSSTIRVLK